MQSGPDVGGGRPLARSWRQRLIRASAAHFDNRTVAILERKAQIPIAVHLIKSAKVLLAICALACLPSCAWAWGNEGHRIIALIAADKLTPAARAQVSDLLGGDARSTMEAVSTWADEIRRDRPETAPWHYVNIEVSTNGYDAARDCPRGDCVVSQVQRDERIVADDRLAKPVHAEALRFLIHFVGDLHQPLHCADNHDRGGNEVRVVIGATETTLHAVWDTNVVASLGENPDQLASKLEAQITPEEEQSWSAGTPVDWANESFRVAKDVIYSSLHGEGGTTEPILLPIDYAARERPVTAKQLERAGIRLATVLNAALVSTDHPASGPPALPRTSGKRLRSGALSMRCVRLDQG